MKDRAAYQAAGVGQQTVESSGASHLPPVSADTEKVRTKRASDLGTGNMTGINSPYEPPTHPAVTVDCSIESVDESANRVFTLIADLP